MPAPGQASFQRPKGESAFAPGHVLVRFRRGKSQAAMAAAHAAVGAQVLRSYRVVSGLQLVSLAPGMAVSEAVRRYRQNPDVLYAEPDYIQHADDVPTPNDPLYSNLWGLHNTGQNGGTPGADISAPEAWSLSTGSGSVVIGTIDTGVDYNHADLTANIYSNASECGGTPGVDDDGNGYIDDCHGIDTYNHDSDPMDDAGHGTHVAGTIGAVGNNSVGVVGVNWNVKIYACKFLNSGGGGLTSGAIECLNYFAMMKDRGVNLVATNNSWGGGAYSQALSDAIAAHRDRGILFIAAAGNAAADNDSDAHYPSNYFVSNIISVAATTSTDSLAGFSDWGRNSVHLGAPGAYIYSTIPGSYAYYSGTSMATPHVTGVAALLKAQNPSRTWIDIKNLILAGGDTTAALSNTITGKRLNAYGAMTCGSSAVHSRLQPVGPLVTAVVGSEAVFAELAINCTVPDGGSGMPVTIGPGGSVEMLDDGSGADQAAGDGVYTASSLIEQNGIFTLNFPGGDAVTAEILIPYSFPTLPAYSYRTITGTDLDLGDDTTATITSPFPVRFGDGSFTNLTVGSNGIITLAGTLNSYAGAYLPKPGSNVIIAPWWDDLMPQVGDPAHNVYWAVTGSAPNRELVIEWRNVPHYETSLNLAENVTFEVVFFEANSDILFQYKDAYFGGGSAAHDQGLTASIGVQVASDSGTQWGYYAPYLNDSMAVLWQLSGNPVPGLFALSPSSAGQGSSGFTLTLDGTGFMNGSVVRWGGADRTTHFVSDTELTADIPASDLVAAGMVDVTVFNPSPGGGTSHPRLFTIDNPVPVLTSIDPTSVLAGGPDLTLTANGSDFVSNASVKWDGTALATTYVNSGQLTAVVPAAAVALGATHAVQVLNPAPGGGTSTSSTFTVLNPRPVMGGLTPALASAGSPDVTVTITGSDFMPTSYAVFMTPPSTFTNLTTTYVSPTELTATVPAALMAGGCWCGIAVETPTPGGGGSATAFTFQVQNPLPTAGSLYPSTISVDHAQFFLTVEGTGFNPTSVVRWNGAARDTTLVSSTQVRATILASDLITVGTADVTVFNPDPVGGESSPLTFTIRTRRTANDFDGDNMSDILWQNASTGDVAVWLMDGASRTSSAVVASGIDLNWKSVGVGDFDGDGKADILWQNSATGGVVVWLMDGAARTSSDFVATGVGSDWKVAGVGDFDGDGKADILWQNSATGGVVVWLMNGASKTSSAFVATGVDPNWKVAGVGDFDGDGMADILWQNSSTGDVLVWLMKGSTKTSSAFVATGLDPSWKVVGVGDFQDDGKADILWQNSATGGVVVWLMNGASKTSSAFVATGVDANWKAVAVADFNDDRKADILWQNSAAGGVVVWLMDGASKTSSAFVATGVDPNWKVVSSHP